MPIPAIAKAPLYDYEPSIPAAIIFIVLFSGLAILHILRIFLRKTWFYIPVAIGGIFEVIGYACRLVGHYTPRATIPYIITSVLVLVAPALFAASIYMTLGRIIRATNGGRLSIIRSTWLTKIFVTGDVLSFFVQAAGGGLLSSGVNNPKMIKIGQDIILAGLFIQLFIFGIFVATAVIFHMRLRKSPTKESLELELEWVKMLWVLYALSAFIMIRNVYRVVEYIQGNDGYLRTSEWPTYVFDAAIMSSVMAVMFWWYPNMLYRSKGSNNETFRLDEMESSIVQETYDSSSNNR